MSKIQISKCYLIQILDDEGNELSCEYFFGNRKETESYARTMKKQVEKKENIDND